MIYSIKSLAQYLCLLYSDKYQPRTPRNGFIGLPPSVGNVVTPKSLPNVS
ncbi:Uncharacterised protein [Staphylococcus aureus]|nr:Uncharacterised protein [Staphylococcus aureus]